MSESIDAPRPRFGVADLVAAIVVGLFFAAAAWGAFGNLVGVPGVLAAAGRSASVPWASLVASFAAPFVLFVAALLLGRGRPTFARTLILVAALAAESALALTLYFMSLSALPA